MKKCANPHDSCAIPHTPHNGNVKKGFLFGKPLMKNPYENKSSVVTSFCMIPLYFPWEMPYVMPYVIP